MNSGRYMVLVVESEDEARELVSQISEDGKRIIRRNAELCAQNNPGRVRCECFSCSINRWIDEKAE